MVNLKKSLKEINYPKIFYTKTHNNKNTWIVSQNFNDLALLFKQNKTDNEYKDFVLNKLKILNIHSVSIDRHPSFIVFRHNFYIRNFTRNGMNIFTSHSIIFCTKNTYTNSQIYNNDDVYIN